jgi:hypothetical protein
MTITYDEFAKVDIRVDTIVEAEPYPEARKPAFKPKIDFGPRIGIKKTSAQITKYYKLEQLPGRQWSTSRPSRSASSSPKCWCWAFRTRMLIGARTPKPIYTHAPMRP